MTAKRARESVRDYLVYALLDPESCEVRYIGKSSSGLVRPKAHLEPAYSQRHRGHKRTWLNKLRREGKQPRIEVLSRHASNEECLAAEVEYIALYRRLGARLTNQTNGGEGTCGRKRPADEIEKQASQLRGRRRPPEVTAKVLATKRLRGTLNGCAAPEVRKAISDTLKARGGTHLVGRNMRTGEVVRFPSIKQAKEAGHSARTILWYLRGCPPKRACKYPAADWAWEVAA